MMVLPEKSWLSRNVLMIFGATYHHIGNPTNTLSYASMLPSFSAMAGREAGSFISMVLRLVLSLQSRSALVYGVFGLSRISQRWLPQRGSPPASS